MQTLRDELLQSQATVMDLAKWKLIAVGATAITGLGFPGDRAPNAESGVLVLFSSGFVAAYVDVLIYRRLLAIHTIGRYLRLHPGDDDESSKLQRWETFMRELRNSTRLEFSERWAHLGSSLLIAIGLPLLALVRYKPWLDHPCMRRSLLERPIRERTRCRQRCFTSRDHGPRDRPRGGSMDRHPRPHPERRRPGYRGSRLVHDVHRGRGLPLLRDEHPLLKQVCSSGLFWIRTARARRVLRAPSAP